MSELRKIEYLRQYIHEVSEEIKMLDLKKVQLSSNGYYGLILQRKSLCNLVALAKNELKNQLNQYNFVAVGNISSKKGEVREKVYKGKVYSEFSFPLRNAKSSNISTELVKPLMELIRKECEHKFLNGDFAVRSLRRAKKASHHLTVV